VGGNPSKKRVIVLDDELEMRIFISNLLNANGFKTIDLADARLAMQLARQRHPALIILNAMMASGEGVQIYGRFKRDRQLKEIPMLLLSTIDCRTLFFYRKRLHQTSNFRLPQPDAYLRKPLEGEELLALVHRLAYNRRSVGAGIQLKGV